MEAGAAPDAEPLHSWTVFVHESHGFYVSCIHQARAPARRTRHRAVVARDCTHSAGAAAAAHPAAGLARERPLLAKQKARGWRAGAEARRAAGQVSFHFWPLSGALATAQLIVQPFEVTRLSSHPFDVLIQACPPPRPPFLY